MFDNTGSTLKGIAKAVFALGSILGIISGITLIVKGFAFVGIICLVLTPILSYISGIALYSIGRTEETTEYISNELTKLKKSFNAQPDEKNTSSVNPVFTKRINNSLSYDEKAKKEKLDALEKMLKQGYISEEAYQKRKEAINNEYRLLDNDR